MSYQNNSYQGKRRQASSTGSNFLSQFGRTAVLLWNFFRGKKSQTFDSAKMLAQFSEIEALLKNNDEIHAAQAVVRADSFLDGIMKTAGGQGATFADRLRSLEKRFSSDIYQSIWNAHKLRNTIAHEQITVSVGQAQGAVQVYRRAASQLGAF